MQLCNTGGNARSYIGVTSRTYIPARPINNFSFSVIIFFSVSILTSSLSLPAGLRVAQRSYAIVFTQWSKTGFFAPQGRHVALINVKFGTGKRTVPNFTFIGVKMWEYSPQNLKFQILPEICTSGRLVCSIFMKFSAFVRVYR